MDIVHLWRACSEFKAHSGRSADITDVLDHIIYGGFQGAFDNESIVQEMNTEMNTG